MSEIKITKDSLENAILRDGLLVFGNVSNEIDNIITSSSSGAFAGGYVYDSEIGAYSFGAFANGCAINNSSIIASGQGAHAEGYADEGTINASGQGAHAEGYADEGTINASGYGAHAEGYAYKGTINASGYGAHAEGYAYKGTINASGYGAHAEGLNTNATNTGAHAEGLNTNATNTGAHAEGWKTTASGFFSHSEGNATTASGRYSHAEGFDTSAIGNNSHTEGAGTIANQEAMTAIGKYNKTYEPADLSTLFVVGDGINSITHNAFTVSTSTNYAGYSALATVNGISDVYLGCPIGTIVMWAGGKSDVNWDPSTDAPDGWLICDGRVIPTNESYEEVLDDYDDFLNLLDIIGTKYGTYTTSTVISTTIKTVKNEGLKKSTQYVHIPDFTKHFPLGAGYSTGTYAHHEAYFNINGGDKIYKSYNGSTGGESEHTLTANESGLPKHSHGIGTEGSGEGTYAKINGTWLTPQGRLYETSEQGGHSATYAHNNIPPFLAINFIIKYK